MGGKWKLRADNVLMRTLSDPTAVGHRTVREEE